MMKTLLLSNAAAPGAIAARSGQNQPTASERRVSRPIFCGGERFKAAAIPGRSAKREGERTKTTVFWSFEGFFRFEMK